MHIVSAIKYYVNVEVERSVYVKSNSGLLKAEFTTFIRVNKFFETRSPTPTKK